VGGKYLACAFEERHLIIRRRVWDLQDNMDKVGRQASCGMCISNDDTDDRGRGAPVSNSPGCPLRSSLLSGQCH
jgi:hypothetical protein